MSAAMMYMTEALLAALAVTLAVYGGYVVDALDQRLSGRVSSRVRQAVKALAVWVLLGVASAALFTCALLVAR